MSYLNDAIVPLPGPLQAAVQSAIGDSMSSETVSMLEKPRLNPTSTLLAGIARNQEFLKYFKRAMAEYSQRGITSFRWDEVVIGGGIHAAIYCANRPSKKILVIEAHQLGGVMDSNQPMFYLNSRNRPLNEYDIPGMGASLNHLPGCLFQAADINGAEYQTNNMMAFAAAANIVLNATYLSNCQVYQVQSKGGKRYKYRISADDYYVYTNRVVVATGLGKPRRIRKAVTFKEFTEFLEKSTSPLRDAKRVAVIGAGNTGDVAVELLTGQGPSAPWPGSLDYVEQVDWFGAKSCLYESEWTAEARPRYKQIGSLLDVRVTRLLQRVESVIDSTTLNPKQYVVDDEGSIKGPYDFVIDCTGFKQDLDFLSGFELPSTYVYADGLTPVARKIPGEDIYLIGPAAQLPKVKEEFKKVKSGLNETENLVAIWRYGKKTAEFSRAK